jgi:hypothetical protein
MFMSHVDYRGIQFAVGMVLKDEDGREFKVAAVTSRIVVIENMSGDFVESVVHSFASLKYRIVVN